MHTININVWKLCFLVKHEIQKLPMYNLFVYIEQFYFYISEGLKEEKSYFPGLLIKFCGTKVWF